MSNEWIYQQNIERFRDRLAAASDERQRIIMTELLAQEQAKLNRLRATQQSRHRAADRQNSVLKPPEI